MTTITLEGKEYQLDIEQAKKLNLLKEKDNKVKSWEEFKEKYKSNIAYGFVDLLGVEKFPGGISSTRNQLTPHEATALTAFSKLLKLRRDWIVEWEPDWTDNNENKYCICNGLRNLDTIGLAVDYFIYLTKPLSFPTEQMAREFLETFRDLIEEAKILI
jgi:hypothetical protein